MEKELLNSSLTLTFSGNKRRSFNNIKPDAENTKIYSTSTAMADLLRPTLDRVQRTTNELLSR